MTLELVETAALILELLSRCDHGVVALLRVGDPGPLHISKERHWKGNPHTCSGLCNDLSARILERSRAEETVPGDSGGA